MARKLQPRRYLNALLFSIKSAELTEVNTGLQVYIVFLEEVETYSSKV